MIVGITGRAGSGKSQAAAWVQAAFNTKIFDLDQIGHQLLLNPDVKAQLKVIFGDSVFDDAGSVKRSALAHRVFSDKHALIQLNRVMHPLIKQQTLDEISQLKLTQYDFVLIVGALIKEIGLACCCDYMIVIDAEDSAAAVSVKRPIHLFQRSREDYKALADGVISNQFNAAYKKDVLDCFKSLLEFN